MVLPRYKFCRTLGTFDLIWKTFFFKGLGYGNSAYGVLRLGTLVCLIVVQDILIIFRQFSSQDILIRPRMLINFWEISQQDAYLDNFFYRICHFLGQFFLDLFLFCSGLLLKVMLEIEVKMVFFAPSLWKSGKLSSQDDNWFLRIVPPGRLFGPGR